METPNKVNAAPSPSGQLPVAVTTPAQHAAMTRRRLRGMWIYTLLSMWAFLLMFGFFTALIVLAHQSAGLVTIWAWLLHGLNAAAAVAVGIISARLKPGFGAPINPWLLGVSALPAATMFLLSLAVEQIAIWFQLPLVTWLSVAVGFLKPP